MTSKLIYLHGFASSPGSKKARFFEQRLAQHGLRLVIPDLAEGNFEALSITGQLAGIERAAAGESVSLIGSSLGGYLAALYASQHPAVERVVLMAPAFCFGKRWVESMGSAPVEVFHYGDGRTRLLGSQLAEDAAQYPDFPDFRQPGLILHGRRDTVVPVDLSEEFAAGHPNVELKIYDSDHELVDVLEPMWTAVERFLLRTTS